MQRLQQCPQNFAALASSSYHKRLRPHVIWMRSSRIGSIHLKVVGHINVYKWGLPPSCILTVFKGSFLYKSYFSSAHQITSHGPPPGVGYFSSIHSQASQKGSFGCPTALKVCHIQPSLLQIPTKVIRKQHRVIKQNLRCNLGYNDDLDLHLRLLPQYKWFIMTCQIAGTVRSMNCYLQM